MKHRYKPKLHNNLNIGDLVLIKDNLIKRVNLPLARVQEVVLNDLEECTEAVVQNASGERVRRH